MNSDSLKTNVAIIGAGSAGLAAFREARRHTTDVLLIDPGPLGTTCARTGCMPSKVLLHIANEFHRCGALDSIGIRGCDGPSVDLPAALRHVRRLRDRFADGMAETTRELAGNRLLNARAELIDKHHLLAGTQRIEAEKIIIATGAGPRVPDEWMKFRDRVLTSETVFEQKTLPRRLAVIGLGPIGLELGQAFSRLGLDVTGFHASDQIGGLSDPQVHQELFRLISAEFPLHTGAFATVDDEDGQLTVRTDGESIQVDAVLAATGTVPNLHGLGLERIGIDPSAKELPCNPQTGQLRDLPIYITGDANGIRPVLHEALDDGTLAAHDALGDGESACGCRRVPLTIVFSDPEVAVVGTAFSDLPQGAVTGAVNFKEQARAIVDGCNAGRLHLYADPQNGRLLGAEAVAPDAAHTAHLLALALQRECTVFDLLQMPFYHPTLTEALRTALRHAAEQCTPETRVRAPILDWCCTETPLA